LHSNDLPNDFKILKPRLEVLYFKKGRIGQSFMILIELAIKRVELFFNDE
jgi:hypothetical protein